jgi:hypothetical protein
MRYSRDRGGGHATLRSLGRQGKVFGQVVSGRADANIRFDELRALLLSCGFSERSRGSHHVFSRSGVEEQINLQRDGSKAKPYQVKQVRAVLQRYGLQPESA